VRIAIALLLACGSSQPGSAPETGDAARIICEGECKHDARCGNPPDCARCATLPVRTPPVWSSSWAREVAACIERAPCTHDAEESCIYTSRRTKAAVACADAHDGMCAVLEGLTPEADARITACYQRHEDNCRPEFDWK
jgi:hypothetical protein